MRRTIIGVMGPGVPESELVARSAYEMGRLIAEKGWVLLTGGRSAGVMDEASRGAHDGGGLVVGVLPDDDDSHLSRFVDIAIRTGMGSARNNINVLSSDVVVACGMGAGTASEVSLALKAGKPVVLLSASVADYEFFSRIDAKRVRLAESAGQALEIVENLLERTRLSSLD